MSVIRKHPIVVFIALAFGLTYLVGLPWAMLTEELEASLGLREEFLSLLVMRAAPTLAGWFIVVIVAGWAGMGVWARQILRWRVPPQYYAALIGIVLAPFIATVATITGPGILSSTGDLAADRNWLDLARDYGVELVYITLTNGEETGWRFALLGLLLISMRVFPAALVVGLVWGLWHMPAMFLFNQAAYWYPLAIVCVAWSVVYAWLYLRTQSLLMPVLAHGFANATFYWFERNFPQMNGLWEKAGAGGDWIFAAYGSAVALVILALDWRLFAERCETPPGENWANSQSNRD